jgi:hypothetical protein
MRVDQASLRQAVVSYMPAAGCSRGPVGVLATAGRAARQLAQTVCGKVCTAVAVGDGRRTSCVA